MICNTLPALQSLDHWQQQRSSNNVNLKLLPATCSINLLCSSRNLSTARVCTDLSPPAVFSLMDGGLLDSSGSGPEEVESSTVKPKRIPWNKGKKFIPAKRTPEEQALIEAKRRERISAANKGRLPWNIGRKHSPETIKRIRERTRLAMTDVQVKNKLRGYQQKLSSDVKLKIQISIRKHWANKSEVRSKQNEMVAEWKESIAEAARIGGLSDGELQWDSYQVLLEELREELKEKMKELRRKPKGPYSAEHRKKISDAIRAKWASADYRDNVMRGVEHLYKNRTRSEPKPRVPRVRSAPQGVPKVPRSPRAPKVKKVSSKVDLEHKEKQNTKVKINGVAHPEVPLPVFVDLEATDKIQKLQQLRASRMLLEVKKKEAAERARMLMAEAEKAAKALEAVAYKDQFAMASLLETRRLLAEAAQSIEAAESGRTGFKHDQETTTSDDELLPNQPSVFKDGGTSKDESTTTTTTTSMENAPNAGVLGLWTEDDIILVEGRGRHSGKSKARKRWHLGRLVDED